MKVLVTGAGGFIGKHLSTELSSEGYRVVALHRNYDFVIDKSNPFSLSIDLSDRNAVEILANQQHQCDYIVHAAACLSNDLYLPDLSLSNCLATQNILWLAEKWKVKRFIYLSSIPIIGKPSYTPIDEKHPVSPNTAYHASKYFGEQLIRIATTHGLSSVSLRLSAPVGNGMPQNRLLPYLIKSAKNRKPIELFGEGTRSQNYVDIRDIVQAVSLALKSEITGLFNIAGVETITNYSLAQKCVDFFSSTSTIILRKKIDTEDGYLWDISIEKARLKLGYDPKFLICDSIISLANEL